MIIDFHAHLLHPDTYAQAYWDGWAEVSALMVNIPVEKVRKRMPDFYDLSGDMAVEHMDKAGIDLSVMLCADWGTARHVGEPRLSIDEINRVYGEVARKHPKRLISFAGIDPRRPQAAQRLEGFIKDYGLKGIKLHSSVGYYPNDKICYPIYELAAEYKLPVLFHTGEMLQPFYFKYNQPIFLQEVAVDFPEVPMIFAHAGGCWRKEAMAICANCTNVYLDLALWQPKLFQPMAFYRTLKELLTRVPWQRVLFGSDFPILTRVVSQEKWVKAFTEIPESVKAEGIDFPREVIEAVMGGNAARILGLTD